MSANNSSFSRRRFLQLFGLAAGSCASIHFLKASNSGHPFASFDHEMDAFMKARGIPGGALAVSRNQRLVYAAGYGWANIEKKIRAHQETLFRIASLSKPITAAAVLKLVEQEKLSLENKAFDILPLDPGLGAGQRPDPRLKHITIRHLLTHTAGWDRNISGDPMFQSDQIARVLNCRRPPGPKDIIRYMLGRPLDFDPGSRYAYSNFGYCVLGRIIEQITGQSYENYVRKEILQPVGIPDMCIGASLESEARPNEAHYYAAGNRRVPSVFADFPGSVPVPYGSFCLEAMDAHGGWIASVLDLVRWLAVLEPNHPKSMLKQKTFSEIVAPPPPPVWRQDDGKLAPAYYGCGWMVRPLKESGVNLWHAGSLPGTFSFMVRLANNLSWVVLFNQRSEKKSLPDDAIDAALHRAAANVKDWPHGTPLL
jgi:N-acyl-D-amino-acid deacylase